jgi:hypothetical protein
MIRFVIVTVTELKISLLITRTDTHKEGEKITSVRSNCAKYQQNKQGTEPRLNLR